MNWRSFFNKLDIDRGSSQGSGYQMELLPFRPGLVAVIASALILITSFTRPKPSAALSPQVILAGRRLTDSMGAFPYVVTQLVKAMTDASTCKALPRVLVMGLTFKENSP
jgi:hypothetical protein